MTATTRLDQPSVAGLPVLVPSGSPLDLGERGVTFVRTRAGRPGVAPVVLLHGLTAGSGINWLHCFEPLAERGSVIAPDLRGHGGGLPAPRRFDLDLAADDVVATLDALAVGEPAIVVGYSMGGAVAQIIARRHAERVRGLVLVSTAMRFRMSPIGKRLYATNALAARAARVLPTPVRRRLARRVVGVDDPALVDWFVAESARHSPAGLVRSAHALHRFRSESWVSELTVPTAVVVTTEDRSLAPSLQRGLADAVPGATVVESPTGHADLVFDPGDAVPAVLGAVDAVLAG